MDSELDEMHQPQIGAHDILLLALIKNPMLLLYVLYLSNRSYGINFYHYVFVEHLSFMDNKIFSPDARYIHE